MFDKKYYTKLVQSGKFDIARKIILNAIRNATRNNDFNLIDDLDSLLGWQHQVELQWEY